jgi:hypothetical protein
VYRSGPTSRRPLALSGSIATQVIGGRQPPLERVGVDGLEAADRGADLLAGGGARRLVQAAAPRPFSLVPIADAPASPRAGNRGDEVLT